MGEGVFESIRLARYDVVRKNAMARKMKSDEQGRFGENEWLPALSLCAPPTTLDLEEGASLAQ